MSTRCAAMVGLRGHHNELSWYVKVTSPVITRPRGTTGGPVHSLCLLLAVMALAAAAPVWADEAMVVQRVSRMLEFPHHADRIFVRFNPLTTSEARQSAHGLAGATLLRTDRYVDGLCLVTIPTGELSTALTSYLSDQHVMYAEPDYFVFPSGVCDDPVPPPAPFLGDDPDEHWGRLWGLDNQGQDIVPDNDVDDCGNKGADIRALGAWQTWTGDPDFRIAVIDTGVASISSRGPGRDRAGVTVPIKNA